MSNSSSNQPADAYNPVLVIAVSSRTLFDLTDEHDVYLKDGVDKYRNKDHAGYVFRRRRGDQRGTFVHVDSRYPQAGQPDGNKCFMRRIKKKPVESRRSDGFNK